MKFSIQFQFSLGNRKQGRTQIGRSSESKILFVLFVLCTGAGQPRGSSAFPYTQAGSGTNLFLKIFFFKNIYVLLGK